MKFDAKTLDAVKEAFSGDGKRILIYHRDADGVTSAAQIMKLYRGFSPICREGPMMDDEFVNNVISARPLSVTFVDIPADQHGEKLLEIAEKTGAKIIIIDHHPIEKDMNAEGMVHISNMLLEDERNKYIPASAIIWRMLKEMGHDAGGLSWIAGIGIIGDYGVSACADVIDEIKKREPELVKGDVMKSPLSKGAEMISAAITVNGIKGADYSLKVMLSAENFYDFISDPKLVEWHEILEAERERILDDFATSKNIDEEKKIIFYEIKSDFSISSLISSIVSEMHEDYIIVIYKKKNGQYKVSLRCQDGHADVGEIAKKASREIGTGGGHKKAAGALVSDIDKFISRIRELA